MILDEDAAAAPERAGEIPGEVLPEFRTGRVDGVGHRIPDARPRRVHGASVHVFLFHVLERSFQKVFGHHVLLTCRALARDALPFQFSLEAAANSMEPDGHVVFLDLEHPRELVNRQALDMAQQE